jgi:molybdenum-dependent DNA-binding transcriptional regulator ModE
MDLRRLRYFVAVAEEGSFNRAAQRLHIAQPPLSNQINQLEEELGVLLFERTSRGVRMTEAGDLLLEEARLIFMQVDQTVRIVRRVGHGEVGRVALVPASLRNLRRRGVVYKSVSGLSPTVELGMIWRRDGAGMVLNSFLQVVREGIRDEGVSGDGREQLGLRDPSERSPAGTRSEPRSWVNCVR